MSVRPISGFDDRVEIIVQVVATNLAALLYAVVVLQLLGLPSSVYKLLIFSSILIVLPVCSAAIIRAVRREPRDASEFTDVAIMAGVAVSACLLAAISVVVWLFRIPVPVSNLMIRSGLAVVICAHLGFLAAGWFAGASTRHRLTLSMTRGLTLDGRASASLGFVLIVSVGMLLAFYIGIGNPFINLSLNLVLGLSPKPSWVIIILSAVLAIGVIYVCFRLISANAADRSERGFWTPARVALVSVIVAVPYFYFDYKFNTDVLHFLTNAGPASQIILADTVAMVTAFSQYGPGPMVLTWLTFLATSPSFHAANIVSQLHSLAFYCVVLLCLFRMTPYRTAAMLLGFFAIGVLMAGWGGGNGSLNSVPSSMGMRYLPNAMLVLAISYLPAKRTLSAFVFLAMVLAGLWSFETLAGSVAILGIFILISSVRERDVVGFFRNLLFGILGPTVAAVLLTSAATLLWSGQFPDYLAYLQFALVYNMTSEFWSLDATGTFLGWIPVAAAVMAVLTLAWLSAIGGPSDRASPFDIYVLIYRFVPMAALTGFMSSYFAGRSVDFTLIISFLPFSVLVIPTILAVFHEAKPDRASWGRAPSIQLAAVLALVVFLALSFSFSAMYRKNAPYATAISECLYNWNCTPFGLASATAQRYALRPILDQAANPNFYETTGFTKDALGLIERYASDRREIPLFLGVHPTSIWSIHTNAVLVLARKGHRWPISFVLSDEINPKLRQAIASADVKLQEGEVVFIRTDESKLGLLEAAIVARIRSSVRLCPLPPSSGMVTAYRATLSQQCERGT
ncbi:MAG: hypothetical protein Q7T81_15945 [Pseudolabrys sp.]|nr:hypothetical protein [Pseudolabrys sp.]